MTGPITSMHTCSAGVRNMQLGDETRLTQLCLLLLSAEGQVLHSMYALYARAQA